MSTDSILEGVVEALRSAAYDDTITDEIGIADAVIDTLAAAPGEEDVAAAELVMHEHYLDLATDGGCVCGEWVDGEQEESWDRHLLDVIIGLGWRPVRDPS